MAGFGNITIDVDIEPSEKAKELIRSVVRQELALGASAQESACGKQWDELIREIVREEFLKVLSEPQMVARALAPAISKEIIRLVRVQE